MGTKVMEVGGGEEGSSSSLSIGRKLFSAFSWMVSRGHRPSPEIIPYENIQGEHRKEANEAFQKLRFVPTRELKLEGDF